MSMTILEMGAPKKRSVELCSGFIKHFYFIEREVMRTLAGYFVSMSSWELKKRLPRHFWQDSLRAKALRERVLEMRYPRKDVDDEHDAGLRVYLESLIKCHNDAELIEGVYFVTKTKLLQAYNHYLILADPVDDAPTIAFMPGFIAQLQDQVEQMRADYARHCTPGSNEQAWRKAELEQAFDQILIRLGLLPGDMPTKAQCEFAVFNRPDYEPPRMPVRDPRFQPAPLHEVKLNLENFIENQLFQAITHVNEMWAAEIAALVMWTWADMPWEFYLDCARWSYDESRHSLMGEIRLRELGLEPGIDYPVVPFEFDSVYDYGAELAVLLFLHKQEMGGPAWKSGLKAEFETKGDSVSAQSFDYDWADESIHLMYGHKWSLHRFQGDMDKMEEKMDELREKYLEYKERIFPVWDSEPFLSRLRARVQELEAGSHG